jgi:pimeloyl-ACP methyl ester carboxylesterase
MNSAPGASREHLHLGAGPCEAEIIAGGGHVPHRELPDRISSRIAAFLSKIA